MGPPLPIAFLLFSFPETLRGEAGTGSRNVALPGEAAQAFRSSDQAGSGGQAEAFLPTQPGYFTLPPTTALLWRHAAPCWLCWQNAAKDLHPSLPLGWRLGGSEEHVCLLPPAILGLHGETSLELPGTQSCLLSEHTNE